jgi:hypothetical protein
MQHCVPEVKNAELTSITLTGIDVIKVDIREHVPAGQRQFCTFTLLSS